MLEPDGGYSPRLGAFGEIPGFRSAIAFGTGHPRWLGRGLLGRTENEFPARGTEAASREPGQDYGLRKMI
jgi:hypothetical protein